MRWSLFGLDDLAVSLGEGDMDMDRAAGGLTVCWLTVDLPFERLWFLGLCWLMIGLDEMVSFVIVLMLLV